MLSKATASHLLLYAAEMGGLLRAALVSALSLTAVVAIVAFILRWKACFFFLFP